jgi:hypothetical protein
MLLSNNGPQAIVIERYHDGFPRNAGTNIIPKFYYDYVKTISRIKTLLQAPFLIEIRSNLAAISALPVPPLAGSLRLSLWPARSTLTDLSPAVSSWPSVAPISAASAPGGSG